MVLVVDTTKLEDLNVLVTEAVLNLDPYLPPQLVIAGGGYVVRHTEAGPEVLLIFRRGAWDLPKGKQDAGETPEQTALREVQEELGIVQLDIVRPLGTTVHGYEQKGRYMVKTTYWYEMRTPERAFKPEAGEGIEQVEWVPWAEARQRVGFESLRQHMETIRF